MLVAIAARMQEPIISSISPIMMMRRSIVPVPATTIGPEKAATSPVVVTACPAAPLDAPRSFATGVRMLTGSSSAVTSPETPKASEKIASQAAFGCC
ncbi:MAG: hypothetical protein CL949_09555 [Erythrobacter sp.]|nr:hypothetical protein [Erythrobacter sp.]